MAAPDRPDGLCDGLPDGLPRRTLLSGAAAVGVGLVASACSSGTQTGTASPGSASATPTGTTGPTSTSASAASSSAAAVTTDHVMPDPGPRQGGLVAHADILVIGGQTISDRTIAAISRIDGVYDIDVISVAQPVIQNRSLLVAAVDPATYRSYTTGAAADTTAVWQRVAQGEIAVKDKLKSTLPVDAQGYLRLGTAKSAPEIHVGAYTPQSPLIDAVVNASWVPTLGMTPRNAVLVRTAGSSPQQVRKPLLKLLGSDVSVQLVDIATRLGIDPSAQQVALPTGSVADAVGVYRYSVLGGGAISPDPTWVADHIVTARVPILGDIVCNSVMVPQLTAALDDVVDRGLTAAIKPSEYAGCYVPRFIAGTSTLSNHAFGLAVDLNAIENQRGTPGDMDPGVVEIFEHWGFTWGGTWTYTDPMHFEVNTIVTPSSAGSSANSSGGPSARPSARAAQPSALASASAQTGTDQ